MHTSSYTAAQFASQSTLEALQARSSGLRRIGCFLWETIDLLIAPASLSLQPRYGAPKGRKTRQSYGGGGERGTHQRRGRRSGGEVQVRS